jgi:hypothetical protein
MKNQTIHYFATGLIALATLAAPLAGHAELHSKSKEIIVLEPKDLPEQAQLSGDDLFLHADNAGRNYLYLEQENGTRLTVLDVTNLARIKPVSMIPLTVAGPFDFVRTLNDRAELIRFRQGGGVAVLDLAKANRPEVHSIASMAAAEQTEPLGLTALLAEPELVNHVQAAPRDFQVVDISTSFNPVVMTTIKQVEHRIVNDETGTTFLLGGQGLTVIRQPGVEEDYREHEAQLDRN